MRRRRRAVVGGAVAVVLGACVGCASGTSSPSAAGTTSGAAGTAPAGTGAPALPSAPATDASTPAATTPAAASSTTAAAGAGGSGSGSGTASCRDGALRTASAPAGAGAGHEGMVLTFTNTGSSPCSLYGYPGAVLVGAGGRTVLNAQRTMSGYLGGAQGYSGPPSVTVAPGAAASALLEWSDVPTGSGTPVGADCPGMDSLHLLVTPPNTTATVTLDAIASACEGFQIHPVVPGTAGR